MFENKNQVICMYNTQCFIKNMYISPCGYIEIISKCFIPHIDLLNVSVLGEKTY